MDNDYNVIQCYQCLVAYDGSKFKLCPSCGYEHNPLAKPACEICKFRVENNCVRYPPKIFVIDHETKTILSEFPVICFDEWCGEWKHGDTGNE